MVNHTAIHPDPELFDDECPDTDYGNHTDQQQDGEYDWSTSKQGWILSSFFYGYVLTQVRKQRAHVFSFPQNVCQLIAQIMLIKFQCRQRLIGIIQIAHFVVA